MIKQDVFAAVIQAVITKYPAFDGVLNTTGDNENNMPKITPNGYFIVKNR